ncbi:MAG: putative metallophosphoesterase [Elusimicrobia bacterium ADurb.Bin231]|nr:MAG: putative metallophosphoesterase [Elusimicrobia bacterium ADurb.Bin231]
MNEWAMISDGLIIAGIEDLTSSMRIAGKGELDIKRVLSGRPDFSTVFLSHSPLKTDIIASLGTDLMISGHTHNGQIWPFKYVIRRRYKFLSGRYDINGMILIVNRGTGTWGPRMRLWARGEISLITICSSVEEK